mgnify:CR=1 FL=1
MKKIVLVSFDERTRDVLDHLIPLLRGSMYPVIIKSFLDPEQNDWIEGNDEMLERFRNPRMQEFGELSDETELNDLKGGVNENVHIKKMSPLSVTSEEFKIVSKLLEGINPGDMVVSFMDMSSANRILAARFFSDRLTGEGCSTFCFTLNGGRFSAYKDVEIQNREYLDLSMQFNGVVALPPSFTLNGKNADLAHLIRHLAKMIFSPGLVNLDHADLLATSKGGTVLVMTWGLAQPGGNSASTSVNDALGSDLCNVDLRTVRKALINVVGGTTLSLEDSLVAAEVVKRRIKEDSRIIWGVTTTDESEEDLEIFLILATTPLELLLHWYSQQ